jgi:hypothetical protein
MPRQPLFAGLVVDENDRPVGTAYVGEEPCYVVDDSGFLRHIPSEHVDRQVLEKMRAQISGNEGMLSDAAAKMLGTEDIFSKALLEQQLKNIEQQFGRAYIGMMGFKVVINVHGEVIRLEQPSAPEADGGGEE